MTSEIEKKALLVDEAGLTVVSLKGSPSEMGWQHGTVLKNQIHIIRNGLIRYLSDLTWGIGGRLLYSISLLLAKTMDRHIPRTLKTEMVAISEAAEVPYLFILLLNVLDDLFNSFACSSFAVTGDRAEGGLTISGRNLDYGILMNLMTRFNTVFVYGPKEGYAFLSVGWPGYIGCVTGMNACGLVLGGHASNTLDKTRKGIVTGILYRLALQHSASLGDMEQIITSAPRTIGNNILLASQNEVFVLEVSAKRWCCRSDEDGIVTVTNHYQTRDMSWVQAPFVSKPPGSSLPDECFTGGFSVFRDRQLRESCKNGPFGIDRAIETLRTHGVATPGTVQSVVFLPAQKTLWVAQSLNTPASSGRFVKLEGLL